MRLSLAAWIGLICPLGQPHVERHHHDDRNASIILQKNVALDEEEKETDPPVDKEHRTSEAPAE